ncbi:hypothetical protein BGZ51_001288 [Haplosporangium sp. Z 767]|nr:hypothetical protein BGZ51_001288 [Haplosporangium sp. Z 767]
MEKEEFTNPSEQTLSSTLAPPPAAPVRRRSKLACDTCHYRKIKCDVEKGVPCKNCEKSAVQCTLVGSALRPPRNISGSTSAAAAAAVAVAVATAAAANAQTGTGNTTSGQGIDRGNTGDSSIAWATEADNQDISGAGVESNSTKALGVLVRRASASGQLMRGDEEVSASSDDSKGKRNLTNSSSSPTSLRALFNAGATDNRSSSTAPSQSVFQIGDTSTHSIKGTLASQGDTSNDIQMDSNVHSISVGVGIGTGLGHGAGNGYDYFDHPPTYSSGSSSTSSTPSGPALIANGMARFTYPTDAMSSTVAHLLSPLSSPLCHPQPSSLPPTPMHAISDRLPESILAGPGRFSSSHSQFHAPPPQPPSHPRQSTQRRASSSSFLPSQPSMDGETRAPHHDRRTSAPWAGYSYPHSIPYDARTQPGSIAPQGQQYGGAMHSVMKKPYATAEDILPYSSHSVLMRSNSTPAALRSPLKSLNRNRHSALPSRRSHVGPTRNSVNLYASTDKVIQDLSLPQKLYRHSALPQRHTSSLSQLQFQLQLQQRQHSQQHAQRSQSLPRFHPEQPHRSSLQQQQQQQQQQQHQPPLWPGFHQRQHRATDLPFDLITTTTQPMISVAVSMAEPEPPSSVQPATILSPIGIHSPTQSDITDFQSFASQMTTAYYPSTTDDINPNLGMSTMTRNDLASQQHDHQQQQSEERALDLQFAPGYVWPHEENPARAAQSHARHQSASQIYPQQPLQFQSSSTQQKIFLTRSLQDLNQYSTAVDVQQQQWADQVRLLQEEAARAPQPVHPPAPEHGGSQDMFGASLALVLDDNLRLLDDMEVVPELNEYEELVQPPLAVRPPINQETLIQGTELSSQTDQSVVGPPPPTAPPPPIANLTHQPPVSILDAIVRSETNAQNSIFLGGEGFKSDASQGTRVIHFQSAPHIDTLSFLDLSGSFMPPSGTGSSTTSTATSSSLPNTSYLDLHGGDRLYQGFVPNFQQHQMNSPMTQFPQEHGQQRPQQHIIHHQHHHHHHVHLH